MLRLLIATLLLGSALFASDTATKAKESMQQLGKNLKGELKAKFKEDPSGVKAIEYCSLQAQDITEEVNSKLDSDVEVRRTALKYRNEKNEPTFQDIDVMLEFQARAKDGESFQEMTKVVETDEKTYVYKALGVGKGCLKCHGDVNNIDKEILSIIDKHYPNDRARNFNKGELRGAIVAEIKK
ncbi:MAG: DUF3365 domain-containing protein [Campylobacterales bacterium]